MDANPCQIAHCRNMQLPTNSQLELRRHLLLVDCLLLLLFCVEYLVAIITLTTVSHSADLNLLCKSQYMTLLMEK